MQKTILKTKAKLDIGSLQAIALVIALTALIAAFTLQIMGDVQGDMETDSEEYNATGEGIEAVGTIPEKLPIIITVVVAAIIIGVLVTYFGGRKR